MEAQPPELPVNPSGQAHVPAQHHVPVQHPRARPAPTCLCRGRRGPGHPSPRSCPCSQRAARGRRAGTAARWPAPPRRGAAPGRRRRQSRWHTAGPAAACRPAGGAGVAGFCVCLCVCVCVRRGVKGGGMLQNMGTAGRQSNWLCRPRLLTPCQPAPHVNQHPTNATPSPPHTAAPSCPPPAPTHPTQSAAHKCMPLQHPH